MVDYAYARMGDPNAGSTDLRTAGNGSITRLAPVPIFYAATPGLADSPLPGVDGIPDEWLAALA